MSFGKRPAVKRYEHGSRVPGWDEAVDLTKPPATVPDPALTPVPEELRASIEHSMGEYPDFHSASIPALHMAQDYHGWLSPEAIEQVACVMQLTPAYLTSVASFYDMFSLQPKPKHDVYVCTNITCSLLGADDFFEVITAGESTLGVGPIALGLALVAGRDCAALTRIANMPGRLWGVSFDCEITEGVYGVGFVMRPNDKFFCEFAVSEARQSKYARRVSRRRIAVEFARQAAEQRLGLILTHPANFPDDLMLAR